MLKGIKFDCVIILDGVPRGSNPQVFLNAPPLIVLITAQSLEKVLLTQSVKFKQVLA